MNWEDKIQTVCLMFTCGLIGYIVALIKCETRIEEAEDNVITDLYLKVLERL